jgi:hypothetical protein
MNTVKIKDYFRDFLNESYGINPQPLPLREIVMFPMVDSAYDWNEVNAPPETNKRLAKIPKVLEMLEEQPIEDFVSDYFGEIRNLRNFRVGQGGGLAFTVQ